MDSSVESSAYIVSTDGFNAEPKSDMQQNLQDSSLGNTNEAFQSKLDVVARMAIGDQPVDAHQTIGQMKSTKKHIMLYDVDVICPLLKDISRAATTTTTQQSNTDDGKASQLSAVGCMKKTACSICSVSFESHSEQVLHFKSDWHHFNVRQRLRNIAPLTETDFENLHLDDLSSISGSESNSTDEDADGEVSIFGSGLSKDMASDQSGVHRSSKVACFLGNGFQLSLHRCLFTSLSKDDTMTSAELKDYLQTLPSLNLRWAIVMASAGHFAAAIFEGPNVVQHKTFHRYVIRAKRGTAQGSCDNKGSHAPKSAGSSLRRHNEAALTQEIRDQLTLWSEDLKKCSHIFLRAPGRNQAIFFGGKQPVFTKFDRRLHAISVETKRPTFREVKRIHKLLATVEIEVSGNADVDTNSSHPTPSEAAINTVLSSTLSPSDVDASTSTSDKNVDKSLVKSVVDALVPPGPLTINSANCDPEFSDDIDSETSKVIVDDVSGEVFDRLYAACKTGAVEEVTNVLQSICDKSSTEDSKEVPAFSSASLLNVINRRVGQQSSTLLHVASRCGHAAVVRLLLEHGADPTSRDTRHNPPYSVASSKEVKNEYRRFMADNMDLHDYVRAQIPGPLTNEMEADKKVKEAAKKKAKRAAKKDKLKEAKIEEEREKKEKELKEMEEMKKKAFLALSDREKRALAAEKRFQLQQQTAPTRSFYYMFSSVTPPPSAAAPRAAGVEGTEWEPPDNRCMIL